MGNKIKNNTKKILLIIMFSLLAVDITQQFILHYYYGESAIISALLF